MSNLALQSESHEAGRDDSVSLDIDLRCVRSRPLVVVSGELDLASEPLLASVFDHVFARHPEAAVRADLGAVSFADSHGLAPILDNDAIEVIAASPAVRRTMLLLDRQRSTAPNLQ